MAPRGGGAGAPPPPPVRSVCEVHRFVAVLDFSRMPPSLLPARVGVGVGISGGGGEAPRLRRSGPAQKLER